MTSFVHQFPVEAVVRIWDVYLTEGRKTIFRLALAIMKINEAKLMEADEVGCFGTFKSYREIVDVDELFTVAFGQFKFSKQTMDKLCSEYQNSKK